MNTLKLTKKYQTYPEYKDSGIEWLGKIPEDWKVGKVKETFNLVKERSFNNSESEVLSLTLQGIKVRDVSNNEGQIASSYEGYRKIYKGDIVLNPMDLVRGFVDSSKLEGIISPAYSTLRKKDIEINSDFYGYFFQKHYFEGIFYPFGNGVSVDHRWTLKDDTLINFPLIVIPKDQQQKIATYLDEKTSLIDQTISKKQKLIELLREKRTAVINQVVTKGIDPEVKMKESGLPWVKKIPNSWKLLPNRSFLKRVKVFIGDRISEFQLLSLTKTGVIIRDVSESKGKFSVDMSIYQVVKPGNLIFCLFDIQETPRTVGLAKDHGMITGAYTVFENKDLNLMRYIEYFYIAMDNGKRLSYLYTGLRNTIPPSRFLSIKTPIPPEEERDKIINFLDDELKRIDEILNKVEKSIQLLQEFKSSLISNVVSGKVKI